MHTRSILSWLRRNRLWLLLFVTCYCSVYYVWSRIVMDDAVRRGSSGYFYVYPNTPFKKGCHIACHVFFLPLSEVDHQVGRRSPSPSTSSVPMK